MKVVGIDIGLDGGIATSDTTTFIMPTDTIELKPARTKFVRDTKGNKVLFKSGPRKGQAKTIITTPAKTTRELNLMDIICLFCSTPLVIKPVVDVIVLEQPGNSVGNSARSTASTFRRYGELLAISKLFAKEVVTVAANKWKKDLGLSKDKEECVAKAEELSGLTFRTDRGALLDGPAEAWLIRYWYINFKGDTNERNS